MNGSTGTKVATMPNAKYHYKFKGIDALDGDQFGIAYLNAARQRRILNFSNKDLEQMIKELQRIQNRPRIQDK